VISHRLGRFRSQIDEHFESHLNINRSLNPLLFFAALYHDIGKPRTREIDQEGRIRYIEHEVIGADLIEERARAFQLSNVEIERLLTIVRNHMRPLWLTQTGKPPSRRAIYRFYKDCGAAGVDVCLLSLADTLATYGPTLPSDLWAQQVDVVRSLLESWWESKDQVINPPALVNGDDLMNELGLKPGPLVGRLLAEIREAQAEGLLHNSRQALEFASEKINKSEDGESVI
jgi:putative nucleotidyltransferase with HDIG domain